MAAAEETTVKTERPSPEADRVDLVGRVVHELREGGAAQAVFAALIAWAITIGPAALARTAGVLSLFFAFLALLMGLTVPLLVPTRPRLASHIGITGFLLFATATWLTASPAIQTTRLDPTRACIGAVAWGVFALSWRERWSPPKSQDV